LSRNVIWMSNGMGCLQRDYSMLSNNLPLIPWLSKHCDKEPYDLKVFLLKFQIIHILLSYYLLSLVNQEASIKFKSMIIIKHNYNNFILNKNIKNNII
jgi:hypothetical protein